MKRFKKRNNKESVLVLIDSEKVDLQVYTPKNIFKGLWSQFLGVGKDYKKNVEELFERYNKGNDTVFILLKKAEGVYTEEDFTLGIHKVIVKIITKNYTDFAIEEKNKSYQGLVKYFEEGGELPK